MLYFFSKAADFPTVCVLSHFGRWLFVSNPQYFDFITKDCTDNVEFSINLDFIDHIDIINCI